MNIIRLRKKLLAILLASSLLAVTSITVLAASNDGWTEASQTQTAQNGKWNEWCTAWETTKNNYTQISLTPGKNASELNFAWYSKDSEPEPKLKFGKNKDLSDSTEVPVTSESAINGYKSNKATAANLQGNTTYYYSYQIHGKWSDPTVYKTQNSKNFSFIYVGDPQIGSSSSNIATGTFSEQGQDSAVRNDSFNWNNTLNTALKNHGNVSFLLSAGDQIQSSDKKDKSFTGNEIEYAGYLSPNVLKSLPAATSIGNHDAPSTNYSYHFNNPNTSNLASTPAGGDYYFSYGNALFIMLNTNNVNVAEHEKIIEQAINENPNAKWRITAVHQDIYGSGEHSNEPDVINLRYQLVPILEKNNIDVVLTGHDHTYSRSFILKGGVQDKSKAITTDEFNNYSSGKTAADSKYNDYLTSIEDTNSVQDVTQKNGSVTDPKGILYMTAGSASGSKYYDLVPKKQAYIAARWQEDTPTYSVIDIDDSSFTINTYKTDNNTKIDDTFSIVKTANNSSVNQVANSDAGSTANKTGTLSSNIDTIKIIVGIFILALAIISVFAYLNLDKNKLKDYFKK